MSLKASTATNNGIGGPIKVIEVPPDRLPQLVYLNTRTGGRIRQPSESDEYWTDLRKKSHLNIPDGAQHYFTKHFDPDQVQYYFYDHVSGASTWDSPIGVNDDMPVYRPPGLVDEMMTTQSAAAVVNKRLVERRRKAYDQFQLEKSEKLVIEWELQRKAELNRVDNIWKKAAIEASHAEGRFELSWTKLEVVNPILYQFQNQFGMKIQSLKLVGIDLKVLPDEICTKLISLEKLSLANNLLSHLPDCITQLTNLRELNLLKNKLVELPQKIGT